MRSVKAYKDAIESIRYQQRGTYKNNCAHGDVNTQIVDMNYEIRSTNMDRNDSHSHVYDEHLNTNSIFFQSSFVIFQQCLVRFPQRHAHNTRSECVIS